MVGKIWCGCDQGSLASVRYVVCAGKRELPRVRSARRALQLADVFLPCWHRLAPSCVAASSHGGGEGVGGQAGAGSGQSPCMTSHVAVASSIEVSTLDEGRSRGLEESRVVPACRFKLIAELRDLSTVPTVPTVPVAPSCCPCWCAPLPLKKCASHDTTMAAGWSSPLPRAARRLDSRRRY